LQHRGGVVSAAFSLDGTRVVTASNDGTTHAWELPLAAGTLIAWHLIAYRASPYAITNGVLSTSP